MPKPLTVCITTNWKILRDRNTRPPYLPLEKPVSRSRSDRTAHGTMYWFQIGKGVCLGCILSPCLFNLYAEYIMRNAGLEEAQAGIKIPRRHINNLRYADDTTLMAESEEELKILLMKVKEESEKICLKLNIQKTKILASSPITSWQIDGETTETDRLFSWAPKSLQMVTAAMKLTSTCPWKKSHDQPRQHIEKQRRYFADKGPFSQSYGFPSSHVWMWELDHKESWVQKNWCFWTVVLEMTEDGWAGWHHQQWTWVWASSRSWWWTKGPGMLQSIGLKRVGHDWATELMVGLIVTSSKRAYTTPRSAAPRAPTP